MNCYAKSWTFGLLITIWLAGSIDQLAFAQSTEEPSGTSVDDKSQEEEEEDFEAEIFFAPTDTVTSVTRRELPLVKSPSAVTVLTRYDIEMSGASSFPELLRIVPNMDIYRFRPMFYLVGVRGTTSILSNRILLLVDNRDTTMEFFGAPFWAIQHFSLEEIERVEVIRGPGSSLYGANAFSGVVQVITKPPNSMPTASLSLQGGENGLFQLSCRGGEKFGPVSLGLSVGMERENFWSMPGIPNKEMIRGKLSSAIEFGNSTALTLEAGVYQVTGALYTDMGNFELDDTVNFYSRARFEYGALAIQAVHDRYLIDGDLKMKLYMPSMNMIVAALPPADAIIDKFSIWAQHSLNLPANIVTYGAEYTLNRYTANLLVDPEQFEHRLGFFIQDEFELQEAFDKLFAVQIPTMILTAGLRVDLNSITQLELSPRVALVYAINDDQSVRMGYSHAFLKPTFFESSVKIHLLDINHLGVNQLSTANPDLDNEIVDSLDLGYTGSFLDQRIELKADFAYNFYRNTISFIYNPDQLKKNNFGVPIFEGSGFRFENTTGGKNGHDLELQIAVRPSRNSRFFFQAGYRQLFDATTSKFIRSEPVIQLAAGADLTQTEKWSISLRCFYTSAFEAYTVNPISYLSPPMRVELPGTLLFNARIAWMLVQSPLDLSLGVEVFNLFGSRHRQYGGITNANGPDSGAENLSRQVILFLRGQI